jgi:hypothetical protein
MVAKARRNELGDIAGPLLNIIRPCIRFLITAYQLKLLPSPETGRHSSVFPMVNFIRIASGSLRKTILNY